MNNTLKLRLLDQWHSGRARSDAMLYQNPRRMRFNQSPHTKLAVVIGLLFLTAAVDSVCAQKYTREMDTPAKVSLSVKSTNGRVSVIASDEQQKKLTIEASSAGAVVD